MNLRDVKILLHEPDRDVRSVLRGKLREMGYEAIQDALTAESVEKALTGGDIDLAILETRHRNDDICLLVKDLRHGDRGTNPFPIAIATCRSAEQQHMECVVDAGFDSALIKPLDADSMSKRLRYFRENRKPFIVTHDYIGPDRRATHRPSGRESRMISVPNPVKIIADGLGRDYLQRQIRDARYELDEEKMIKDGASIKWLVDRLCAAAVSSDSKAPQQCIMLARHLRAQAQAMNRRSGRTSFIHVSDLCLTIAEVATRMAEAGMLPTQKDLELLDNLNRAVARGLQGEAGEEIFAQEIQRSVLPEE